MVLTKTGGIIVGAVAHEENLYDGHTLPGVLQQTEALTGNVPAVAIVDRGHRGTRQVGDTEILVPGPKSKEHSPHHSRTMRQRFRRHCAIEPVIGHLKSDYRLARNYLKGFAGDTRNLLLVAAVWNFKKWLNLVVSLWLNCLRLLLQPSESPRYASPLFKERLNSLGTPCGNRASRCHFMTRVSCSAEEANVIDE